MCLIEIYPNSFLFQVAAVCDFFTYIRYIVQGLVKAEGNVLSSLPLFYQEFRKCLCWHVTKKPIAQN